MYIDDNYLDTDKYSINRNQNLAGRHIWYNQEYYLAYKLLNNAISGYQDMGISEFLQSERIENEGGNCLLIEESFQINLPNFDREIVKSIFSRYLRLLRGIGEIQEIRLRDRGFHNLKDLTKHPRWHFEADSVLKIIDEDDVFSLYDLLSQRLMQNHQLFYSLGKLFSPEEIIYLDIETLGLVSQPIIVVGLAEYMDKQIFTYQYVLTDLKCESSLYYSLRKHLRGKKVIVTYNGKNFDIPYIKQRLNYFNLETLPELLNLDLLYLVRKLWKEKIPNCKLCTVEKYKLGINRELDIPGALVPEFYYAFYSSNNTGPLKLIIEHNRQDIISMIYLIYRLWNELG